MSKISVIQRQKKREILFKKYFNKIKLLKNVLKNTKTNESDRNLARWRIQKIPRNASVTRNRNRCFITGRSRGVFRRFGVSRCVIRELAFKGYIPGIFKASW